MPKTPLSCRVVEIPPARRDTHNYLDLYWWKHSIYALLEVDVTTARLFIDEYEAQTGEALSFTGYLAFCLVSNLSLLEVGTGAAKLSAGLSPDAVGILPGARHDLLWVGLVPWVLRGLLAIPALQVLGVATTLLLVRRWQHRPESRPTRRRMWTLHIGPPLILNLLLVAAMIGILTRGVTRFLFVYGPDFSWLLLICGSFAALWIIVRTVLILRTLESNGPSYPLTQSTAAAAERTAT